VVTQEQVQGLRDRLEEELASVERHLEEHGAGPNPEGSVRVDTDEGFADSAAATTERSEMLSMIEQLQRNYADIKAALERMNQGTYGKCERCGQDIPFERLEARPVARLCVTCQQAVS
jgi:DnaK suppressor protein